MIIGKTQWRSCFVGTRILSSSFFLISCFRSFTHLCFHSMHVQTGHSSRPLELVCLLATRGLILQWFGLLKKVAVSHAQKKIFPSWTAPMTINLIPYKWQKSLKSKRAPEGFATKCRVFINMMGTVDLLAIEPHLWRQDGPGSTSPLPVATEVEEEEALMALADLSDSEMLGCKHDRCRSKNILSPCLFLVAV